MIDDPGAAPTSPPVETDAPAIHYHFPVEVEVRTTPAEVDLTKLSDHVLERLAGALQRP